MNMMGGMAGMAGMGGMGGMRGFGDMMMNNPRFPMMPMRGGFNARGSDSILTNKLQ